jgi:Domain of unknown function (DUF4129)
MINPGPITRDGAQRDAKRELAKAIYHRNSEPLPVRAVRAVGRLIDHLLNKVSGVGLTGSGGALALVILIAVVAIVVIWRVGVPRRAAAIGPVLAAGQLVSAAEHRSRSERAAAAGDLHTAVVERMRAIARELEERSVLEPRAGRTATELTREAGLVLPVASSPLGSAAAVFNNIAYGEGEATTADLAVMITADDAIRPSARTSVMAQ